MKKNFPNVIKEKMDERIFYFNKILSQWIAYHANINIKNINEKRLLWFSLLIVFIHDNWHEINNYYPEQTKCNPSYKIFSSLRHKFLLSMKTDFIIYPFPKPRFFNVTGYFHFLISSIKTTFNLIKAIKKKQNIAATNKILSDSLCLQSISVHDDLIFSDIFTIIKRKSARKKLKLFFSKNIIGFDIETLIKIIPSFLVELLPIYKKISSKLSINEIHTWVMDIHESPLLLINCISNKNIKIIGYQHGGGYGYEFDELVEAEMSFYDQFLYWGYSENTIPPFRFRIKNEKKIYSFYPNKLTKKTINFFLDSYVTNTFCSGFNDIKNMAIKLNLIGTNLNIVLHPNDYKFTRGKFNKFTKNTKLYISSNEIRFDKNAIYFVSIYSTLFWKIIDKKLCFICYKQSQLIYLTKYHFKLSNLMEKNKLIYKFNNFSSLLSKDFLNEIISNNENFYKEIEKL